MKNLTSVGNVVIEFYGDGCLNCQMMTPILNNLELLMPHVRFYRINADANQNLVAQYQITSLPSLLIFRNGQLLSRIIGVKPIHTLRKMIEETLRYT